MKLLQYAVIYNTPIWRNIYRRKHKEKMSCISVSFISFVIAMLCYNLSFL